MSVLHIFEGRLNRIQFCGSKFKDVSDQHYREPEDEDTLIIRRTSSFHFVIKGKIFGRTLHLNLGMKQWKMVRF